MSDSPEALVVIDVANTAHRFTAGELPVAIGGRADSDVYVEGVRSEIQIGLLDGAYFAQAGKQAATAQINGVPLRGTQKIDDGDELAIDAARMSCRRSEFGLQIAVRMHVAIARDDAAQQASGAASEVGIAIQPISFRNTAPAVSPHSRFKLTPTSIATGAGFLILAVLAWFAFTAKSIEFVFDESANQVALPSTLFKFRIGDRYMLRAGSHRVQAELEGYYPLDTEIVVGALASQSVQLDFRKLPGLINITADPGDGVEVLLDGRSIGIAPLDRYEIEPGEHELTFTRPRFFPESVALFVEGAQQRQHVNATLRPDWAPVNLVTMPAGAEVVVNGELAGQTPISLELTEGEYSVEVRLAGYNAWQDSLDVVAGEPQRVTPIQLQEADGRVRIVSETSNVAVSLNGEFAGSTPLNLRLRPDRTHTLVATKPGFETVTTTLSVGADSGRTVSLELVELFGAVSISSQPENAEIWIDGDLVGVTPTDLQLSAIPHVIEVRLDGYAIAKRDLTPRAGLTHTLDFPLDYLDELTGAGYERIVTTSLQQALRLLPAGEFTMGSSRREDGRRSNEVLRPVELTTAFYIGTTEVTNAQFRAFRPDHDSGSISGNSLNEDTQPVVNVSWEDVAQYLNWLSIRDGLQPVYSDGPDGWTAVRPLRSGYRLPTEAEWAWASRFVGQVEPLVFPWGTDPADVAPPDRWGNYADIAAKDVVPTSLYTYNDDFAVTAPVGSFDPSAEGLFDLGGNVSEWVHDFYALDVVTSASVAQNPLGPESGAYHIVRGSSWRSASLSDLRSAARGYGSGARDDLGFRIARNLE